MSRTIGSMNPEGYPDPTAREALQTVTDEEIIVEEKVKKLISCLKFIIHESGFELLSRIEIKDSKTGRCFR